MQRLLRAATLLAAGCALLWAEGCGRKDEPASSPSETPVAEEPVVPDPSQFRHLDRTPAHTNSLGMEFVSVPNTQTLFCKWETRVQDYQAFATATAMEWPKPDFEQGPTHPAVNVNWDDAKAFCRWLTEKERAAGQLRADQMYRLPTDLEWSAAAGLAAETGNTPEERSGGVRDLYPWGAAWPPPMWAGNLLGEENRQDSGLGSCVIEGYKDGMARTAAVGSYRPNPYGLYDLSGNAWEWCEDSYDGNSGVRVLRGGSWGLTAPGFLLSSFRYSIAPGFRSPSGGFRCVLASAVEAP
jgi:formylglycine-generating enzyme required for sulfatase activity